ncbi:MAG: CapA family protein [Spirochaetaceae bacterium]|jgi:poly-gamma-glutamate synthesis protein (capsule biosynthesis protein)|nr:CapA family protein [Spirochaetaceae bacterium]
MSYTGDLSGARSQRLRGILCGLCLLCAACAYERGELYFAVQTEDPTLNAAEIERLLSDKAALFASLNLHPWEGQGASPDIFFTIRRFWAYERSVEAELVLERTWFVPCKESDSARISTSLAACLAGEETIVPTAALAPPWSALRVDGLSLTDEGYALVQTVTLSMRGKTPANRGRNAKARGSITALIDALMRVAGRSAKARRRIAAVIDTVRTDLEGSGTRHAAPALVWIAAAGDLMLGRGAQEILLAEGPAGIFGKTAPLLLQADIALLNLEGTISKRGEKIAKSYNFRFDPAVAPELKSAGIDALLCANNHIFDYGLDAFYDTLAYLKDAGIKAVGAGLNEAEAAGAAVFSDLPYTVQVFGLASFPPEQRWDGRSIAAGMDRAGILYSAGTSGAEKLRCATDETTLDIVLLHGGIEWSTEPSGAMRSLGAALVARGADLIIGSHPHIVQGFEWVEGAPVFWSLGNFVFSGMDNTGGERGLFIMLGFVGRRLFYREQYPLILSGPRTEIAF